MQLLVDLGLEMTLSLLTLAQSAPLGIGCLPVVYPGVSVAAGASETGTGRA